MLFQNVFLSCRCSCCCFFLSSTLSFENFPARFKMKIHSKDSGAVRRIFDMGKFALYIIFWILETTTTPKDLYYSKKDNNFKFSKNNWKYISPVRKLIKCRWALLEQITVIFKLNKLWKWGNLAQILRKPADMSHFRRLGHYNCVVVFLKNNRRV